MQLVHVCGISPDFSGLSPCAGHVAHALRTLAPAESIAAPRAAPRLACVRPAASVHPEPGSNSSLYITILIFPVAPVLLSPVRSPGRNRRSYFFGTFSCLLPVFSMNFLFQFFPLLSASPVPLVPNGIAKVLLFSLSPTFFQTFFLIFLPIFLLNTLKILIATRIRRMKNFRFFLISPDTSRKNLSRTSQTRYICCDL